MHFANRPTLPRCYIFPCSSDLSPCDATVLACSDSHAASPPPINPLGKCEPGLVSGGNTPSARDYSRLCYTYYGLYGQPHLSFSYSHMGGAGRWRSLVMHFSKWAQRTTCNVIGDLFTSPRNVLWDAEELRSDTSPNIYL